MIDEIDVILDKATPEQLTESFKIMKKDISKKGGLEMLTLFIQGLRENDFFEYVHFIRGLNG